ncbi:BRO family protein [Pseudoalteromonas umbrosa]|uniref:BRO family protein n=1 Tax=Pseudoalteromonas umbrosa TaxID=3048489 RepID=UPI0024C3DD16|nr:BRO family protein [Pseudoalteromonas sp. B95]MDK1287742.1 BRO family protein [Pseudoalteromonas sp. B95]
MKAGELVKICYEGDTGDNHIRTLMFEDTLYVSLQDILITLNRENRKIDEHFTVKSMAGILKKQMRVLEKDEFILRPKIYPTFEGENEIFVTEPGLYRVLSGDVSKAGKKFQKWLFHKVIPSLSSHGCYPPPESSKGSSLAQMAELLAQNSRVLADTINRQEELESQVIEVKSKVDGVCEKLEKLENKEPHCSYTSVSERLKQLDIFFDDEKILEAVAWCENLNFRQPKPKLPCPNGTRIGALFEIGVVDKAISYIKGA